MSMGIGIDEVVANDDASSTMTDSARSRTDPKPTDAVAAEGDVWAQIDRLEEEQKYQAAADRVEEALVRAIDDQDDQEWTRALVRLIQLQTALHGYETALRTLEERAWPEDGSSRTILQLFRAQAIVNYINVYSWEIRSREQMISNDEIDLDRLTLEQLVGLAQDAYRSLWQGRGALGLRQPAELGEYLDPNNYPARIRGTLRDTVTYLWVEMLSNSALWQPQELNELYLLDLESMIDPVGDPDQSAPLDDGLHPLMRASRLLDDLEQWHRREGSVEAAAQARIEKLSRLHGAFEQEQDRDRIVESMEALLVELDRDLEWWSVGQAELARMVSMGSRPDVLIRARQLAIDGELAHPDTVGAEMCRSIVGRIESPDYNVEAMLSDGARRRSLRVQHKNLDSLYFRAYPIDVRHQIATATDYNLLPGYQEIPDFVRNSPAAFSWQVDLPPTTDYRYHITWVTPPLAEPGLYLIIASAERDFLTTHDGGNRLAGVYLQVTDLVLTTRDIENGLEVEVRSGASGRPIEGVELELYQFDYRKGHRLALRQTTDRDGQVRFHGQDRRQSGSYFLLAETEGEIALDTRRQRFIRSSKPRQASASLIYTDRSVYRPGQSIHWKVVGYRGVSSSGRFETLVTTPMTISLLDGNGESVGSVDVTTNEYGSASGIFDIPVGRMLGEWSVQSSLGGRSSIRVEEYKRPSFEVSILEPDRPLRLNNEAILTGSASYYFGLPVTTGSIRWTVERRPELPLRWYWWGGMSPISAPQTVASGTGAADAQGRFEVSFVPLADERDAAIPGLFYSYRLRVEVTDEGGETSTAERIIRLGFVDVVTRFSPGRGFFRSDRDTELRVIRSDLNGSPSAGGASWRLFRLRQPSAVSMPAELPLAEAPGHDDRFDTPGDRKRPRWDSSYDPAQVLRSWPDGPALSSGGLSHDDEGIAVIDLGELEGGAYRVRHRTEDDFGAELETLFEFVVVDDGSPAVALPALLLVENETISVGERARILVHSALADQSLDLELFRNGSTIERFRLEGDGANRIVEIPIDEGHRGGLGVRLTLLRDHQLIQLTRSIVVPWDDRRLEVRFSSFRDKLRPGGRESWRLEVEGSDGAALASGAAEILAYMYDRSLDLFAAHRPPSIENLYPISTGIGRLSVSLGVSPQIWSDGYFARARSAPTFRTDRLKFFDGYPIGGLGRRRGVEFFAAADAAPMSEARLEAQGSVEEKRSDPQEVMAAGAPPESEATQLRSDFSETAFWLPHLVLGERGSVAFEFTVPDSVTDWNVWVHALTRDLRGGSTQVRTRSVKELMVRPYLPRFLREGDRAELKVMVDNVSPARLSGQLQLDLKDPESEESLLAEFGLEESTASSRRFDVESGQSQTVSFDLQAPTRVGAVAVEVRAIAGELSDGEAHLLPLLPGRVHLSQSRFATLRDRDRRVLRFEDLETRDDPSRLNEQLVVTLDAQLFYGVLGALPYLVDYPYECTEQTLNRFVSTGIVSTLYKSYPEVASMARQLSERQSRLEPWTASDPNRKIGLEETPWLVEARGGETPIEQLANVLDPKIARAQMQASIAELERAQTSIGGFPWWPGGPPSPYMTLYLLHGLSRALEHGIDVPQPLVQRAWSYLHRHFVDEILDDMVSKKCCWEVVTFLNYVLSAYPDPSWTANLFDREARESMLAFSYERWRRHSPLLKSYLALTLHRMERPDEAQLVFASVMDAAISTPDEGIFWAPEDRAWLWYNDTIETHAFALRTLLELTPDDDRRHGLVQWLFLNKKLNHWKSTRATAEVIYALVHYLEGEGNLAVEERATVTVGGASRDVRFDPGVYTGDDLQIRLSGDEIERAIDTGTTTVKVEKSTPGFLFASATWHFSTETLPTSGEGDLFTVERRFFKRIHGDSGYRLEPLSEGARVGIGDQIEVQLAIRARAAAEYVHLRDPRGAGFEPEARSSGYRWDLGLGWYEETRDSGTNFFFDRLPVGEYTLRYRLRAAMSGTFRAGPATLQSMYAPEFTAYSSGLALVIDE